MEQVNKSIDKFTRIVFGTRAAGIYILVFAAAIGIATFIENDYGTSAAYKVIYQARWFELLLLLFSGSIIANIFRYRMIPHRKWSLLIFHGAIIVILIGAGITRYFGSEGMMHIRENDRSSSFLSSETFLQFELNKNGKTYRFDEEVLFASLGDNQWDQSYRVGSDRIDVHVNQFVPNPERVIQDDDNGTPVLKLVVAGQGGREEYFLKKGDRKRIKNLNYNFSRTYIPGAVNLDYRNDSLLMRYDRELTRMVMATQSRDTLYPHGTYELLRLRSLYSDGKNNFVFGGFSPRGKVKLISSDPKVKNESICALDMTIGINDSKENIIVFGKKGLKGRPVKVQAEDVQLAVSYGAKPVPLPFSIHLYDFIMERYPGTNSAASFASEVRLEDPRNQYTEEYRIYMNHILNYDGYRFFQSSYDQDERGTYLSVNNDFWGTWISYLGYILLTIGLIMALFSKNTRFHNLSRKLQKMRSQKGTFLLMLGFLIVSSFSFGNTVPFVPQHLVSKVHAEQFSRLVVQDHKGRMKPVHTLTREVLRKIARKESLFGLTADQVVLGMMAYSHEWQNVSMIKLGEHEKLRKQLDVEGEHASYSDLFNDQGAYKLREEVRAAYGLQPIDRGVYEKELMKIDERVNIASMIFSGRLMRLIPVPGDPNNTWVSSQMRGHDEKAMHHEVAKRFFSAYPVALKEAIATGDYSLVDKMLNELDAYQRKEGAEVMPSDAKINAEILLNNLNVFGRLSVYYLFLGLGFLTLLFLSVFKPNMKLKRTYQLFLGLVILGFLFHSAGLGIRWYVSGRAPWSNGYESMIYIAWTSCLAGLIFTRKSLGGLAATMILAATVLLVATLSYLDPEITPLVPVLRSYWLTIHVSLEAGSYGFLMLGALIGLINLVLMIFLNERNKDRIKRIGTEMTHISEMTLMGGLVMVSIGTFLGGVWANESWGRYWGWDAKETWALVTILVYAFILHMRLIPKLRGIYAFNLASLFGWGSVIMTYYGVNYYLSGLHSYAAGDPVPIPQWVYYVVGSFIVISVVAYFKKRKYGIF